MENRKEEPVRGDWGAGGWRRRKGSSMVVKAALIDKVTSEWRT